MRVAPGWENGCSIQASGCQGGVMGGTDADRTDASALSQTPDRRLPGSTGLQESGPRGLPLSPSPPSHHRLRQPRSRQPQCPALHHLRVPTLHAQHAPQRTSGLQVWAAGRLPFSFSLEGVGVAHAKGPSGPGPLTFTPPTIPSWGPAPALATGCRTQAGTLAGG